jgi:hypothetical protein
VCTKITFLGVYGLFTVNTLPGISWKDFIVILKGFLISIAQKGK